MRFEWDDKKASTNLVKHGVSFAEATQVFDDPNVLEALDAEHSYDEKRFFMIGYSAGRLLSVVYAERHDGVVRIISARPPEPDERRAYEERRG